MKKVNYFAPTIEVVEMVVENGIAASTSESFNLGAGNDENYNDANDDYNYKF